MEYKPFDEVELKDRTDIYRVYTYKSAIIFVGLNSDTVTDENRDTVAMVVSKDRQPDCRVSILKNGTITVKELPDYVTSD